jgi:PKHD-type hydroxylase
MSNFFGTGQRDKSKELLSYYWFENAFSSYQCASIINIGKSYPQEDGTIFADKDKTASFESVRNSTIRWIDLDDPKINWLKDELARMTLEANETLFKLDLYGFTENFQFTEYEGKGKHYNWHPDIGPGQNERKLSIVIQLSNPSDYGGGDLVINNGNPMTPDKSQGSVIIFPSFLLHKVEPLLSGTRYSLVSWVGGPAWR